MQGWAASMLGLTEEEEDLIDREEEDFEVDRLTETVLVRDVFSEAMVTGKCPDQLYRARAERLRLAGKVPVGKLGLIIEKRHREIIAGWQNLLDLIPEKDGDLAAVLSGPLDRVRLGRSGGQASTDRVFDPLAFDLSLAGTESGKKVMPVQLGGLTDGLSEGEPSTIIFLPRKPFPSGKKAVVSSFRYFLRGMVDQALLAAAGVLSAEGSERQILLCFSGGREETALYKMRLQPAGREKALTWLINLSEDLLKGHHAYLLPVEAVIDYYLTLPGVTGGGKGKPMLSGMPSEVFAGTCNGQALVQAVNNLAADDWSRFSSLWGPVPEPRSYLPPEAEEARQMVVRRFGPVFEDIISLEVVK